MFKRFGAGVAVGYVLGARAGQKRYDQISDLAEKALEIPFVEHLADSGRTMAMDQGRRVLAGLKDRAQWTASDEEGDDGGEDGDEADEYPTDDYDAEAEEEPPEDDDEPEDEYDQDDEDEPQDVDDEADEDEPQDVDDEADDDEPQDVDDDDEADEDDGGDSHSSNGHGRRERPRSKRRIGSLASAARERGRVD
ncbi:MAG: hypothetical protein ACRDXE_08300 [Acidimicrobiales bacterium]